ncbi:NAD-dependent epimerase/dehydratase family protein [Candidatus Woesearchaeota archaeon]|nr:NAD-dependent epimerase/dehydratase family protein [Candidatus Woesearchaeota archaeon]
MIGGTGFIGLHLIRSLSGRNYDLTVLSPKNTDVIGKLGFAGSLKAVKGSVADYKCIEDNVKNKDVIINLAAIVNPDSHFEPYGDLEVNCIGQLNILEARKNVNPGSKYIFFGSRAQFGRVKKKDLPISEDSCQRPVSLYGIHKQAAENYCKLYKNAFNLNFVMLRMSIVYGPEIGGENKNNIINKFIRKALNSEEFYVNGYGRDIKDLIYIDDLVALIIKVIESKVDGGIFNVGSGERIRFIDIARNVVNECKSGSFKAVPFPEDLKKFELGSFYFDISKAKKAFGWEAKIKMKEGIKRMVGCCRNIRKK